jgi:hypothetical protein
MLSLLSATITLTRVADKVGFDKIEGKMGAVGAVLSAINRGGWSFDEEPVALDMRTKTMVFRGSGRPGVVLVSEGNRPKSQEMLQKQKKRINRILPGINVILVEAGDSEGQVPLKKLKGKITRRKATLRKSELSEVNNRLRGLGSFKPPIPKGVDPYSVRPNRKAMRG